MSAGNEAGPTFKQAGGGAGGEPDPLNVVGQNMAYFNPDVPLLNATIFDRPAFTYVEVVLEPEQTVMADGGAMLWMDQKLKLKTEMGSCWPACKRSCAGESCFRNFYTCPGRITFGFKLPGDMLPFAVTPGEGWIINSGSFVCGTPNLRVDSRWSGCRACLPCCGDESAFLTRVTVEEGAGVFYAGGYGALSRVEIPEGKFLLVDHGLFFAANAKTEINVALPGGCMGCCCGGEGFCMKLGAGVVYVQNRNPSVWRPLTDPRVTTRGGKHQDIED